MMSRYLYLLLFTICMTSCDQLIAAAAPQLETVQLLQATKINLENMVIDPGEFQDTNASGMSFLPEGLTPDSISTEGTSTSSPIKAPIKFNAVVPQWKIDLPENSEAQLELRTGNDPAQLGEWIQLHASVDWTLPDDEDTVGDMLAVPAHDKTHEYIQYRIVLSRDEDLSGPLLRELKFTFIDSTAGLSSTEMILRQEEINRDRAQAQSLTVEEEADYPKPFVISREVWCTDPACNYTEDLTHHPVTHLILHHTVSSGGGAADSAAVVRAIWTFHTSERGWRDIGYNFLVDTAGVIFEGHLGGDDVVGIHASGANTGSMALAMIGDYSLAKPADPMLNATVDLFAWKADQKNINVFDASNTLPNIEWGLPNLMGHRDVYGTTECPGNVGHTLTPTIRNEVASRIGLESPYIYVDELSSSFQKSNAIWFDGPLQCGHNTHSWYAWSTMDPGRSANWAEWRPLIPESGNYQIEVYAPYCNTGQPETAGARYSVEHAGGTSSILINQDERVGLWTSLGEFALSASKENSVYLANLTTTDEDRGVWFDSIRLLPLEPLPLATLELPADDSWLSTRDVLFTWQLENPDILKIITLQVATDVEFQNRIVNETWSTPLLSATVNFDQDYANLYWRIVVTSESNNEYPSTVSRFSLDSEPPASRVTQLYWFDQAGYYQVFWQGNDALSGIDTFDIHYRLAGTDGQKWQTWLSDTRNFNASFSPPDPDAIYEFRSRAVDKVGNNEILHSSADMSTDKAIRFTHAALLPMVKSD